MKTQTKQIESWLKAGKSITPMLALKKWGCFRLAARIAELRAAGMNIITINVRVSDGHHVAKYWLAE